MDRFYDQYSMQYPGLKHIKCANEDCQWGPKSIGSALCQKHTNQKHHTCFVCTNKNDRNTFGQ